MRTTLRRSVAATCLLCVGAACEDGPERVFSPYGDKLSTQNGEGTFAPYVVDDYAPIVDRDPSDDAGRARFCDTAENDAMVQQMVVKAIVPDVSLGGIPLWAPAGTPILVDDLIGRPEDGKFCDPTYVFSNALVWGPNYEVIVFFNGETRLVEQVLAYPAYLGTLTGNYTEVTGDTEQSVQVAFDLREKVTIGGRELIDYSSQSDQALKVGSWVNHRNVTAMYAMLRETYFGAEPLPAGYDCVQSKLCDIIYSGEDESIPQATSIVFQDSGVFVSLAPDGVVQGVAVTPVRIAPFESEAKISFATQAGGDAPFSPHLVSTMWPDCDLSVTAGITWSQFTERCIGAGAEAERMLGRFNYDVHNARDAVSVEFNGVHLDFMRVDADAAPVLRDGERPAANDQLYSLTFVRNLNATVAEYTPRALAEIYKGKLEARLRQAVLSGDPEHSFSSFELDIPESLATDPQRIGELLYVNEAGERASWLQDVVSDVRGRYDALSTSERLALDGRVVEQGFVIEPFVDAVLAALTHGASESSDTVKRFYESDSRQWSVVYAHFYQDGIPYRVNVQYSLFFHAVTAAGFASGFSRIDEIINTQTRLLRYFWGGSVPYFTADLIDAGGTMNLIGLEGGGITVNGADRRLGTLDISLSVPAVDETGGVNIETHELTVQGTPVMDQGGYLRQIRGQRYEWVPADVVHLYGKETQLSAYVTLDGIIGRVDNPAFKGAVELCRGLRISYGDDVRAAVEQWAASSSLPDYQRCEVVFNYSDNGNVLDSVASLSNRVSVSVSGGRAITVSMWL